jgi:hypothetical protein
MGFDVSYRRCMNPYFMDAETDSENSGRARPRNVASLKSWHPGSRKLQNRPAQRKM